MMKLLQSSDMATSDRRLNSDLRAKIYEQTRLIAELRHNEVNRQQTSRARTRCDFLLVLSDVYSDLQAPQLGCASHDEVNRQHTSPGTYTSPSSS